MPRVPIVVCLIASILASGCASYRQTAPAADAAADEMARVRADAESGRWSIAHPLYTHARWVKPDWWDEHPVATIIAVSGVVAGVAAGVLLILYLKSKTGEGD